MKRLANALAKLRGAASTVHVLGRAPPNRPAFALRQVSPVGASTPGRHSFWHTTPTASTTACAATAAPAQQRGAHQLLQLHARIVTSAAPRNEGAFGSGAASASSAGMQQHMAMPMDGAAASADAAAGAAAAQSEEAHGLPAQPSEDEKDTKGGAKDKAARIPMSTAASSGGRGGWWVALIAAAAAGALAATLFGTAPAAGPAAGGDEAVADRPARAQLLEERRPQWTGGGAAAVLPPAWGGGLAAGDADAAGPTLEPLPPPAALRVALRHWRERAVAATLAAGTAVAEAAAAAASPLQSWLVQAFIEADVATKFLGVFVATMPLILLFGGAYKLSARSSWGTALYKTYALLYRSPVDERSPGANIVANAAFLAGFFSFAMTISLVSEEVNRRFEAIRSGAFAVAERDHLLLLGWNDQALPLLLKIAEAQAADVAAGITAGAWQRPVVVLADRDKKELDQEIREALRSAGADLKVQTRRGVPFRLADLESVSAAQAATIILLPPDPVTADGGFGGAEEEEVVTAATVMSLVAMGARAQRIVVQQPEGAAAGGLLATLASTVGSAAVVNADGRRQAPPLQPPPHPQGRLAVLHLPEQRFLQRLLVHAAAQPDASTAQLRTLPLPAVLEGATYASVRRSFGSLVVCGFVSPTGQMWVNPQEEAVPPPGSRLICLLPPRGSSSSHRASTAPSAAAAQLYASAADVVAERARRPSRWLWPWRRPHSHVVAGELGRSAHADPARRIIVAGAPLSPRSLRELQEGFAAFTPQGTHVTLIFASTPAAGSANGGGGRGAAAAAQHEGGGRRAAAVHPTPPAPRLPMPARVGGCTFSYVFAEHATEHQALLHADVGSADTLVLGGLQAARDGGWQGDARVLASLLQVQEALAAVGRPEPPPHVVAAVSEPGSADAAQRFLRARAAAVARGGGGGGGGGGVHALLAPPEFLLPHDLNAALLTQAAAEPAYSDIVRELLWVTEGHELYLRTPEALGLTQGTAYTFAEAAEAARLSNQTLLGYVALRHQLHHRPGNGSTSSEGGSGGALPPRCTLAPEAGARLVFGHGDRLLVVAEGY